jgi:hypothetical protein
LRIDQLAAVGAPAGLHPLRKVLAVEKNNGV